MTRFWLRVLANRFLRRPSRRRVVLSRPRAELLEDRTVPSTFSAPSDFAVGAIPQAVAVADFNGDGRADLVTMSEDSNTVSVLLGNGDGTFRARTDYAAGATPLSVIAGNLNGDGKPDLVVINGLGHTLSVLLNNGDGSFQAPTSYALGGSPNAVALGDFNRDGLADLAVTTVPATGPASVSVLLGNGDGTFQAVQSFAAGTTPASVAVGDFNSDGRPDLAVTDKSSNTVGVLLGNGDGTFQAVQSFVAGTSPASVAVGDFNGDGRPDLVEASSGTATIELGNGDGTFQAPNALVSEAAGAVTSVAVGDFNGDGRLDLATADAASNTITVLVGNGDGTFRPPTNYATGAGPVALAVADFNGDGHADLVTADNRANAVSVLLGRGDGTFPAAVAFNASTSGSFSEFLVSGDFNGDGHPDLLESGGGVLLGNGDSTFQPLINNPLGITFTSAVAGDFNGDGKLDVVAFVLNGEVVFLAGNGDGTFQAPQKLAVGPGGPAAVAAGDFNGDGKLDLLVLENSFVVSGTLGGGENHGFGSPGSTFPPSYDVLLGNGDGTFQTALITAPNIWSPVVAVGDFNGDGRDDFAFVVDRVSVELSNGDGTFRAVATNPLGFNLTSAVVADFNGDGRPDLAVTSMAPFPSFTSSVLVLPGNGDGTFGTATSYPTGIIAGSLTLADFNQDGTPDLALTNGFAGTVSVLIGNGDGTFGASTSFDAGPNPRSLVAADFSGDGFPDLVVANVSGAGTLTMLPNVADVSELAGAVGFRVSAQAAATTGAPFSVTVTAVDAHGDPVSGFRGAVRLTSSDPRAALPPFYTFTAADAGTHTFNSGAALFAAGGDTITANNPRMAPGGGTVAVSPAAAASLSVTTPAATAAGSPFTFTVTALDAYGNVATGYTGTVVFGSSDAKGVLPDAYTFTASDAGSHSFTASLKTARLQSMTATDITGAASGTGGITVTPLAASTLSLTGFPSAVTAGVAEPFTVTALDVYGNVATGYRGRVGFGSSDLMAQLPLGGYSFTADDAGVHTFNGALRTAGVQWLGVSDIITGGSLTATQSGIVVSAAAAASFAATTFPNTTAGVAQGVTLTAYDAYGNVATGYTGTVKFTSSDTRAALSAAYTFTAADAGAHIFSATLKTVGTQSLTVADTANAGISVTRSGIVVTAAAAASFTVSGFPATTAGVSHTFTVTALDAFGNVAAGFVGTVHFTSSDRQAALPADTTFSAADEGVHTFSAALKTAGPQTITATDTASAAVTGSQAGIVVSAAAVSQFAVSAPSSVTQGKSFLVTLTAEDAYGNVVVGYRGKVHLSSGDTKAGLPSDYTFGANDNGAHTFSVTLNTLGVQALMVTDTANNTIRGNIGVNVTVPVSGGGGGGGGGGGR